MNLCVFGELQICRRFYKGLLRRYFRRIKMTIQTYGKQNLIKKICLDVKNRFRINEHTERALNKRGIGVYVPKLNKLRFTIGLTLAIICIILPVITILSVPCILWGIK